MTVGVNDDRERELERLGRLYEALRLVNRALVRLRGRDELLAEVCSALVEHAGLKLVWVGWHDPATKRITPIARAGPEVSYVDEIMVSSDDIPQGRGPSGVAFRENRPYVCNDMLDDESTLPWRDAVRRHGFRGSAVFPIRRLGSTAGTLSVYADRVGFFQDKEVALLMQAADDISFALDHLAQGEETRRSREAAERERGFVAELSEAIPGVLYLYDEQGRFMRWNRRFEMVTGYSSEEMLRLHPLECFTAEDKPLLEVRIREVFENGEASVEAEFVSKDGTSRPYLFTGRRIMFDGKPALVGVGVDVSARRHAESADRLKSVFLAAMSHELRTPLNSIIGFTGLLLQELPGPLNPEQTKQLGMVRSSARLLLELINDVLDISKIEAGQLNVHYEKVDLRASVERVASTVRPFAEKKGLMLHVVVPDEVLELSSDRRRLEQIMLNLLNNAIKFTERGDVTLEVLRVTGSVVVRVSDTGIGIKPEELHLLFQPFRQIETGLARAHEGTGLGLAICRRLAVLLGGTVDVTSRFGKGSTFTLILPRANAAGGS